MEPETTAQQPNDVELAEEIERLLTKLAQDIKVAAQLGEYAEIAQRFPAAPHRVPAAGTPLQPFKASYEDRLCTWGMLYAFPHELKSINALDDDEDNEGEQYLDDVWYWFRIVL